MGVCREACRIEEIRHQGISENNRDYDPKTDPGELAGKYRVEQGVATYKVVPPPVNPKTKGKR